MNLISPENIKELTPENPYDRFPDGRPKVPDDILERMRKVTTEEAWGVLNRHGYHFQFDWTLNKKRVEQLTKLIQVEVKKEKINDPTGRVSSGYV